MNTDDDYYCLPNDVNINYTSLYDRRCGCINWSYLWRWLIFKCYIYTYMCNCQYELQEHCKSKSCCFWCRRRRQNTNDILGPSTVTTSDNLFTDTETESEFENYADSSSHHVHTRPTILNTKIYPKIACYKSLTWWVLIISLIFYVLNSVFIGYYVHYTITQDVEYDDRRDHIQSSTLSDQSKRVLYSQRIPSSKPISTLYQMGDNQISSSMYSPLDNSKIVVTHTSHHTPTNGVMLDYQTMTHHRSHVLKRWIPKSIWKQSVLLLCMLLSNVFLLIFFMWAFLLQCFNTRLFSCCKQ